VMMEGSVPFIHEPVDVLRQGLPSAKADAQAAHPLQAKLIEEETKERKKELRMMENVFGSAFPIKVQIEEKMMQSVQRLPGLPSSNLVAEALSGKLDDFGFEDVLGHKPEESEVTMPGVHSLMEKRLGVAKAAPSRELP